MRRIFFWLSECHGVTPRSSLSDVRGIPDSARARAAIMAGKIHNFLSPVIRLAPNGEVMTTKFLLMTEPRWVGFLLHQDGQDEAHEFDSISEALEFARTLPDVAGAPFLVLDEKGKEFVSLTV